MGDSSVQEDGGEKDRAVLHASLHRHQVSHLPPHLHPQPHQDHHHLHPSNTPRRHLGHLSVSSPGSHLHTIAGMTSPSPCQARRVLLDSMSSLAPGYGRPGHTLMAITQELISLWPQTNAICLSYDPRVARNVHWKFSNKIGFQMV